MQKFDVILSNAPYDNGLHEKFEMKYFGLCKGQICWVSPLSFLLGKRQNKKITLELDKYATNIEQINGNEFFDAAIGGTMGIVSVDMSDNNLHYVKFDGKEYKECKEISMISNDELLVSVKNKIKQKLSDNLQQYVKKSNITTAFVSAPLVKNPDPEWWVYRTMAFSGQSSARSKEIAEYYALISNKLTYKDTCGQYKDLIKKKIKSSATGKLKSWLEYYFAFETENEVKNFWNFIHTDFVNIILYFYKTSLNIHSGILNEIPWQDFTEEWDDEKLFKKYRITKEEIQHIYDILPNYYGIERINLDKYDD